MRQNEIIHEYGEQALGTNEDEINILSEHQQLDLNTGGLQSTLNNTAQDQRMNPYISNLKRPKS